MLDHQATLQKKKKVIGARNVETLRPSIPYHSFSFKMYALVVSKSFLSRILLIIKMISFSHEQPCVSGAP